MNLRIAKMSDLPQLKRIYRRIIEKMNEDNIPIWDEIYPCEFFAGDINNSCLYVLENDHEIVSAFSLRAENAGTDCVKWESDSSKVLYIDRLGVNVDYLRQGIGSLVLKKAITLAKENGAKYLRLFVVDINHPAINLYIKNGFRRVPGIYNEIIDDELTFHEYGFEANTQLSISQE